MDLTFHWTIATASGQVVYNKTFSADASLPNLDQDVPVGSNFEVLIAIDVSQVKAIQIACTGDVTLKTNSSSSPSNTLQLVANVPYEYHQNSYNTFKLTQDVSKLYVTNNGSSTVRLTVRGLYDPTL